MLFSYNWLKEYLEGAPAPDELSDRLTMSGTEIESVTRTGAAFTNVITAQIISCEKHPNAEKLLRLQIDTGDGERQIVAGIAAYYAPEDLVGRLIVVVKNLKPAKLRGEMSHGMLLAASGPDQVTVLTPLADVPPGSPVS